MKKLLAGPALLALMMSLITPAWVSAQPLPVPPNTLMLIQLETPLDTRTGSVGERFTARVLSPGAYEGGLIRGHIARLERSGRLSGRTEMKLAFDTITLRGATMPIRAELEELRQSESVKVADNEGNVIQSGSRRSQAIKRAGIGAAVGAVVGGLIGGRTGLLIGLLGGGGVGAGSLYVEGPKQLILDPGTEMVIRTVAGGRQLARTEPGFAPGYVQAVQSALDQRGYDAGMPDGVFGPRTRSALAAFQRDNGLPVTGSIDPQTAQMLGVR